MPRQSRRFTDDSEVDHNGSGGPHKTETSPGRVPLPVTSGHRGQTAGDMKHGRRAGSGVVRRDRAGPDHGACEREDHRHPGPPRCPSPPWTPGSCEPTPVPWALQAGRAAPSGAGSGVPALHGGRSPVRDHRQEPGDSTDPADRSQQNDNTEGWRGRTDLPPIRTRRSQQRSRCWKTNPTPRHLSTGTRRGRFRLPRGPASLREDSQSATETRK